MKISRCRHDPNIDSDDGYLVSPKCRRRVARYYHCSIKYTKDCPYKTLYNGSIHVESKTLKRVVALFAESETVGLFHNCQTAVNIYHILEALGYA